VSLGVKRKEKSKNHKKFIIIIIIIIITTNRDYWLDTRVQKKLKKLFAQTTTQKKIVCLEKTFIPPSKKIMVLPLPDIV